MNWAYNSGNVEAEQIVMKYSAYKRLKQKTKKTKPNWKSTAFGISFLADAALTVRAQLIVPITAESHPPTCLRYGQQIGSVLLLLSLDKLKQPKRP